MASTQMPLPKVTDAQYRALVQVDEGNVSYVKGGGWLFSSGARHVATRAVYRRLIDGDLVDLGEGVLIGRTLVYPVEPTDLGRQVLEARRGGGSDA